MRVTQAPLCQGSCSETWGPFVTLVPDPLSVRWFLAPILSDSRLVYNVQITETIPALSFSEIEWIGSEDRPFYPFCVMSAGVNSASKQAQEPCHETPGVEHSMAQTSCCVSSRRAYLTVAVLFLINLLNYMDRFTIAGKATCTRTEIENNAFGQVFEMSRHDIAKDFRPPDNY